MAETFVCFFSCVHTGAPGTTRTKPDRVSGTQGQTGLVPVLPLPAVLPQGHLLPLRTSQELQRSLFRAPGHVRKSGVLDRLSLRFVEDCFG